jgi:hypothetical protein
LTQASVIWVHLLHKLLETRQFAQNANKVGYCVNPKVNAHLVVAIRVLGLLPVRDQFQERRLVQIDKEVVESYVFDESFSVLVTLDASKVFTPLLEVVDPDLNDISLPEQLLHIQVENSLELLVPLELVFLRGI